jgi:hypothetical protein
MMPKSSASPSTLAARVDGLVVRRSSFRVRARFEHRAQTSAARVRGRDRVGTGAEEGKTRERRRAR